MAHDPNMTHSTPVDPDRRNCTCEQPEGHLVCPTHGKWPNRYTPNPLDAAKELNAELDRIDRSDEPVPLRPPDTQGQPHQDDDGGDADSERIRPAATDARQPFCDCGYRLSDPAPTHCTSQTHTTTDRIGTGEYQRELQTRNAELNAVVEVLTELAQQLVDELAIYNASAGALDAAAELGITPTCAECEGTGTIGVVKGERGMCAVCHGKGQVQP